MARKFITADYQATLDLEISLREALPPDHLAHFIVEVVAELDLRRIYRHYGSTGAPPYAPEILLGLLFYGYATGVYSSRKRPPSTRSRSASLRVICTETMTRLLRSASVFWVNSKTFLCKFC